MEIDEASILKKLDHTLKLFDKENYVSGGCTCDMSVNHQCELCWTHSILSEAKRTITNLQEEVAELKRIFKITNSSKLRAARLATDLKERFDCRAKDAGCLQTPLTEFPRTKEDTRECKCLMCNLWWCANVKGYFFCPACKQPSLIRVGEYDGLCEMCFDEQSD